MAHGILVDGLRRLDPATPVVSEEAAAASFETRRGWRRFWLVDPLDGTKEFIKRRAEFTVNVALIEDGEPVLGVVLAPALDLLYWAVKGGGAWREDRGRPAERIYSSVPAPGTPLTVVESLSHPSPELEEYLRTIPVARRVKAGSSLKFCWVAEGRADIYPRLGPTMEWDVAAGGLHLPPVRAGWRAAVAPHLQQAGPSQHQLRHRPVRRADPLAWLLLSSPWFRGRTHRPLPETNVPRFTN